MLSLRQRIRDVVAPIIKLSGKLLHRSPSLTPECQALLREMALGTPKNSQWNELLAFRDRRFREAFRMSVDNDVQRALNKQCGDRYVERGDYQAILNVIDYPCSLDLPQNEIDEAAQTLRSNPLFVSYLRVRIADMGTRLNDMTGNNRDLLQGLKTIVEEKP